MSNLKSLPLVAENLWLKVVHLVSCKIGAVLHFFTFMHWVHFAHCVFFLFCAHIYLHLLNTISFDICCFNVRITMLREVAVVCLFWYYESYSWRQLARPPQQHTDFGKYYKFELANIKQWSYKSWTITRPPQQHTDYIQIWN